MNATRHTPEPIPDLDQRFAQRLRARLDEEVGDVPAGRGPAAATARARARRRTRRAALATAAAIVVVVAGSQVVPDDPERTDVTTASDGVAVDPGLQLDWTVTDDGLMHASSHAAGDAGLYALSTAPRARLEDHPDGDVPRALYRLTEQGTWAAIGLDGDDPDPARVSERGDVLYALSTGTVTGSEGNPLGSVATDGGETWASVPLRAAAAPSGDIPWRVSYSLDLASTSERTLALVTARFDLPWDRLFPELADDAGPEHLTRIEEAGVELVEVDPQGNPGAVVRSIPWSALGVGGREELAPQRRAYVADGDRWTEVAAPDAVASPPAGATSTLQRHGDSFLLVDSVWHEDGTAMTAVHRTTDGEEWAALGAPAPGQLLAVGEALVHVGAGGPDGTSLQQSRDLGATWHPLDVGSLDPAVAAGVEDGWVYGASGPLGAALLVGDRQGQVNTLLFSTDAQHWTVTDLADVGPGGASYSDVLVGTDRLVVLGHTTDGEPGGPQRSATLTAVPRRG